jgi:ATP-dependent DNA helicase
MTAATHPNENQIPVCIYHGTPDERAELRRTVMAPPHVHSAKKQSLKIKKSKSKGKAKSRVKASFSSAPKDRKGAPIVIKDSDEEEFMASFPIVLTTYEMIIKDRLYLSKYHWGYIVVDEGHRLKNLNCALMREIKKYPSAGRMILTGTPLHVSTFTLQTISCPDTGPTRIISPNYGR